MIDKLSNFVRQKRGDLSLREFAKLCGNISHTQIDSIERGVDPRTNKPVRPTIETLQKIAKGTGVKVSYLAALAANEDINDLTNPIKNSPVQFTNHEKELLKKYRQLDADGKKEIENMIDFKLQLQNEKIQRYTTQGRIIFPERWKK